MCMIRQDNYCNDYLVVSTAWEAEIFVHPHKYSLTIYDNPKMLLTCRIHI